MPNRWEIWFAKVKFEDDPSKIKNRPVLVVDQQHAYIVSIKITTHDPRPEFWGELRINKWHEAGLDKPSVLRLSQKLPLIESDFIHKIGRLHPVDIINVQRLLEEHR